MWLVSMCSLILSVSGSEEAGTLDDFLKAASTRNFDARDTAALQAQRAAEHQQQWGKLLPGVSATASYTRNQQANQATFPDGQGGTRVATINALDQLDATLQAQVTVIDAAAWLRTSATAANLEAADLKLKSTQLEVERQVARAYFTYVAAQALVTSTTRNLAATASSLTLTESRKQAGFATDLDIRRGQAEVEKAKQSLADAQYSVGAAKRTLVTLTGLQPSQGINTSSVLNDELALPAQPNDVVDTLPSLHVAQAEERSARRQKTAAWLTLIPTLSASASETFSNAVGFGVNPFWRVALTAKWSFDASTIGNIRLDLARAEQSTVKADRARRQAEEQLEDAYGLLTSSISKARSATAQLESATLAAALAKERFEQGRATQLEVITADRDELDAEVNRIRVFADLKYSRLLLRLVSGESIRDASTSANGGT